jgi:phosphatidylserine decarboxylase
MFCLDEFFPWGSLMWVTLPSQAFFLMISLHLFHTIFLYLLHVPLHMKKKWVLIPIIALLLFTINFFRDPEREIPDEGIISPADGKIIAIEPVTPGKIPVIEKDGIKIYLEDLEGYITQESTLIAIFMSPFDVHVNRSPISGSVSKIIYTPGEHHMATGLALTNERNTIIIDGKMRMIVIQIAGAFARRIQCFIQEGDTVEKGERLGRIIFGSQVVLILPRSCMLSVSVGSSVKAGESIIALPPPHG